MLLNPSGWMQYYLFKGMFLGPTFAAGVSAIHQWNMILLNSTYVFDLSKFRYSDIASAELPTANGYTVGGVSLGNGFSGTGMGIIGLRNRAVFTASGGPLIAQYAAIYDFSDAITPNGLMVVCKLNIDENGICQPVTIPDGQSLNIGCAVDSVSIIQAQA